MCTQIDLDKEVQKASKRIENKKKKEEKENLESTTLSEIDESESPINTETESNEINLEENNDSADNAEENNDSSDNAEENNDSADNTEENKEYDSDSVFAKLQELKND